MWDCVFSFSSRSAGQVALPLDDCVGPGRSVTVMWIVYFGSRKREFLEVRSFHPIEFRPSFHCPFAPFGLPVAWLILECLSISAKK